MPFELAITRIIDKKSQVCPSVNKSRFWLPAIISRSPERADIRPDLISPADILDP